MDVELDLFNSIVVLDVNSLYFNNLQKSVYYFIIIFHLVEAI